VEFTNNHDNYFGGLIAYFTACLQQASPKTLRKQTLD